ncbi:MAG TPA: hypothetical protein VG603_01370 [Chitinophagales bacterium]|nr:hypothetical protein [Chitinophagales bacterium]
MLIDDIEKRIRQQIALQDRPFTMVLILGFAALWMLFLICRILIAHNL